MQFNPSQADAVVVGAGPVGLWTSVLTKIANPQAKIVVLERYNNYTRDNDLLLDRGSFTDIPQDMRIQAVIANWFGAQDSIANIPKHKHIQKIATKTIQEDLEKLAHELGIIVLKGNEHKVASLISLEQTYAQAKLFIGADSAHSFVRKALFGDPNDKQQDTSLKSNKSHQYVAQVKYRTVNSTPKPKLKLENLHDISKVDAVVVEAAKPARAGEVHGNVTLIVDVDLATYEEIKDARGQNFKPLADCPEYLRARVQRWIHSRRDQDIDITPPEVRSIELSSYRSKEIIRLGQDKKPAYALVGDAAFGVPYFRSLNNGLLSGVRLGKEAGKFLKDDKASHLKSYSRYVKVLAFKETLVAKIKALGVRILAWAIKFFGWLPRQLYSWQENYFDDYFKNGMRDPHGINHPENLIWGNDN